MREEMEGMREGRRRFRSGARRDIGSGHRRRSSPPATVALVVGAEVGGRRCEAAALVEDLDPLFSLLELRVAEARQLHAALVQLQRCLEWQVAFFKFLDDRFKL